MEHGPYGSGSASIFRMRSFKKSVKPHFGPALVGVGCVLTSTAQPLLAGTVGSVVVEQGRADVSWSELEFVDSE